MVRYCSTVKASTSGVRSPFLHCTLTRLDVLQQHLNVVVPVRAGLLVVEAQGVQKLMLNSAVVQAATASQRQLLSITTTTNEGVAAAAQMERES